MVPLINGQAYTWSQIICNIAGVPIAGIDAIDYADKQEIVNNYGAGNYPVSRGFGKIEPTCKLALHMEEIEAITNNAPGRRLQDIPEFDVIVSYITNTGSTVTHKIRNCRFKENMRSPKAGDTKIAPDLELIPSHIEW